MCFRISVNVAYDVFGKCHAKPHARNTLFLCIFICIYLLEVGCSSRIPINLGESIFHRTKSTRALRVVRELLLLTVMFFFFQDDILTAAHGYPNLLATGSYDGCIIVWNEETQQVYMKLKDGSICKKRYIVSWIKNGTGSEGRGLGTHLFVKVPLPRDSEGTFSVFESSCHLLLPVQLLKGRAIPLSALPKDTASELASLSPHQPF